MRRSSMFSRPSPDATLQPNEAWQPLPDAGEGANLPGGSTLREFDTTGSLLGLYTGIYQTINLTAGETYQWLLDCTLLTGVGEVVFRTAPSLTTGTVLEGPVSLAVGEVEVIYTPVEDVLCYVIVTVLGLARAVGDGVYARL